VAIQNRPSVRAGAVRIVRPSDVCDLALDVLVVTGLDGYSYGAHEDPLALLDDRTRAVLPAPMRPPSTSRRRAARRAELAWAIANARDVVLCWASAREGEETTPDAWIRRCPPRRVEPASRISAAASVVSARGAELVRLAAGAAPPSDVAVRVAIERERLAFFLEPRMPARSHSGAIELQGARDRAHLAACVGGAAPERAIAVTHLERAMGCAFAAFARRVLHVRRAEDASEAGDPRERGTMVHRALRAAFEAAAGLDDPARALAAARMGAERALASD